MRSASASELPPNLCARQGARSGFWEGSAASCAGTAFIGLPWWGGRASRQGWGAGPVSVECGAGSGMGYPGMTDRTGVVPMVVVVIMVMAAGMAGLCCSAAKAVKRWLRVERSVEAGEPRSMFRCFSGSPAQASDEPPEPALDPVAGLRTRRGSLYCQRGSAVHAAAGSGRCPPCDG